MVGGGAGSGWRLRPGSHHPGGGIIFPAAFTQPEVASVMANAIKENQCFRSRGSEKCVCWEGERHRGGHRGAALRSWIAFKMRSFRSLL